MLNPSSAFLRTRWPQTLHSLHSTYRYRKTMTSPEPKTSLKLLDGDCWIFFAFDVGYSIDLDLAQNQLSGLAPNATRREEIPRSRRRSPESFQYHPAPLQIDQPAPELGSIHLGPFTPLSSVECTLFDFGAISVAYRLPLSGGGGGAGGRGGGAGLSLADLVPLAEALFDCAPLRADAAKRVSTLASRISSAIERPNIARLVEDYTVYHARTWSSSASSAMNAIIADRDALSRVLLAEAGADGLSDEAIDSVLATSISYSAADAVVIDWNAALVLGRDEEDTLSVLEFANVELLEMRFLDDQLDTVLDRTHATLSKRGRLSRLPFGFIFDPQRAERRRLAALQMESAVLFEGVNNALKLVGDQHLARLYNAAAKRFHLADWDRSILRKLHTIDGLYQKLTDEQATRRMEVLEWIIILLFIVSIALPFMTGK